MTISRLNTCLIFSAKPRRKQYFIWDEALKGLGVKITPIGLKFFLISILRGGVRHTEIIGDATVMSLREARAHAKTRIRALSSLYIDVDADTPFEIVAEQVQERQKRLLKPRTIRVNRDYLNSCILPFFTGRAIGSINRLDVEEWFASLADRPAAANRSAPILSVIMREAEEMGARAKDSNPVLGLRRYRKHKRQRIPTADEMAHLGEALEERRKTHPVQVSLFILIILLGCRKSELIDLCWSDYRDGHLYLRDSKTGPKKIFLCSHARAELDRLKTKRSKKVFPSSKKNGKGRICIDNFWRELRKELGMEDVRLHDFRHHHASVAIKGGENINVIGILLGHNSNETTLRYIDLDDEMMREAKKTISMGINSKKGDEDEEGN
jgi:integrase